MWKYQFQPCFQEKGLGFFKICYYAQYYQVWNAHVAQFITYMPRKLNFSFS